MVPKVNPAAAKHATTIPAQPKLINNYIKISEIELEMLFWEKTASNWTKKWKKKYARINEGKKHSPA